MWFPKPLYEVFPYSTMLIGGVALAGANSVIMVISGVLLVFNSGLILKMRRDYRKEREADRIPLNARSSPTRARVSQGRHPRRGRAASSVSVDI